jgi:hypothetical protein
MKKRHDAEQRVLELEATIDKLQSERTALLSEDTGAGKDDAQQDVETGTHDGTPSSFSKQSSRNRCSRLLARVHMFVLWICGKQSIS